MKKVLVIGSGGRCHAIVDALHRSPSVDKIYCAQGNPGIAQLAELVPIKETDISALKEWALQHNIDLTVVGPEVPLAQGIVDEFRRVGLAIFGHTKAATQIESSKEFAKQIMQKAQVATAAYRSFNNYEQALQYVKSMSLPTVIKYDGLAAGKGVVVATTIEQAQTALQDMLMNGSFGTDKVVIEQYLEGPEFSLMCFVSGNQVVPMPLAQDHKRAFDGDEGPNTGGMGAYTPLPFITEENKQYAIKHIMQPVADMMAEQGTPLSGVLYGGLMKTKDGIKVIEFNARFGDPETEVVLPLLESDIYNMFYAVATNQALPTLQWREKAILGVVLASKGYPGHYDKGALISGTEKYDGILYHMGTAIKDGQLQTAGGRVMMALAEADTIKQAQEKVYKQIQKIECDNLFYRNDIAHQAMELTQHREAKIIDGKKIAQEVKDDIKASIEIVVKKGRRRPKLAVILVGNNPASQSYVRSKIKACEYVGIESQLIQLTESSSTEDILYQIDDLNEDPTVDGILVQLPLPEGIDQEKVIRWIDWTKDVDCFHPTNVGNMWIESESFAPCTPQGIAYMLKKTNIDLRGKLAVVVGRSNIVGKPMAKLLLDEDATVVIAHSKTKDLEQITKQADVLVVAVGKKHFIDSRHVKCGATVIDVGINRGEDGKLYGDVNFEDVLPIVSHITPVPGGVGPMTVAILMHNTFHCYINREY